MNNNVLIANISYNPIGWRNLYLNPKAGHSYATEFPGHESLNFKFDKKNVDTDKNIFGYVQWTATPKNFNEGGVVIFYSKNTDSRKGEIVGIYCNVKVLFNRKTVSWNGFENNEIGFNLMADKDLSILFPIPLDAEKYKVNKSKRLVGQIGYSYYDLDIAESIIKDELIELSVSGVQKNELEKLKNIYAYISGSEFNLTEIDIDVNQQEELEQIYLNQRVQIISDLVSINEDKNDSETIIVKQKTYKRDNRTIAQIKILRDYKCQICGKKIKKAKGGFYIEAAHIKPKSKKGREIPDNILILCPNHHKEFDFGTLIILMHTKEFIEFELNGTFYKINLKIK